MSLADEIPGLRDAIAKENFVREVPFLGVTERIAGFEVVQMTLEQFLLLRLIKSPFIVGGRISRTKLVQFLWFLSPHYSPRSRFRKTIHGFLCSCRLGSDEGFAGAIMEAMEYIDDTLQDWPSSAEGAETVQYFSDPAAIVGQFGREYGWPPQVTLKTPLKIILQLVKEIRAAHGEKLLFNPSDRVKSDWLKRINANGHD